MHIALLGGRFDPPHNGHLEIARYILRQGIGIQEVWFIPANTHPWRPIIVSAKDRLAMTELLEEEYIKVSNRDITRGGETYTIDTVHELLKNTEHTYFWVLGSDQIQNFHRWKDYKELQKLIQFFVIPREGYEEIELPDNFHVISGSYQPTDLSSSEIRDRIQNGLPISDFVPKKVEEYIRAHKLYKVVVSR